MYKLIIIALAATILTVGCSKNNHSSERALGVASVSVTGIKEFYGNEISFVTEPNRCEDLFSMGYATIHIAAPAGAVGTAEVQCGGTTLTGASCTATAPGTCVATGDLTKSSGVFSCNFTNPSGATILATCHFDL